MTEPTTPTDDRCEVCDWPLASSREQGCVPGDCSYRPAPGTEEHARTARHRADLAALSTRPAPVDSQSFQKRVLNWLMECFSMEVCRDGQERNHRFLEESLELVQSLGCTRSEAHQLVDYTFGRPAGEPTQELGGVMVTLAALCFPNDLDMAAAAEKELARVWSKINVIRAKQASKPKHSPLPEGPAAEGAGERAALLKVFEFANELTNSIDCWSEDVGGYRKPDVILRDLGPACDEVSKAILAPSPDAGRPLGKEDAIRRTLEWYADVNNYLQRNGPCVFVPTVEDDTLQAPALDDQGRRAREALAAAPQPTDEVKS